MQFLRNFQYSFPHRQGDVLQYSVTIKTSSFLGKKKPTEFSAICMLQETDILRMNAELKTFMKRPFLWSIRKKALAKLQVQCSTVNSELHGKHDRCTEYYWWPNRSFRLYLTNDNFFLPPSLSFQFPSLSWGNANPINNSFGWFPRQEALRRAHLAVCDNTARLPDR